MNIKIRNRFLLTIVIVFLLMLIMIAYTLGSFFSTSVDHIEALGRSSLAYETAKIENYLRQGLDVVQVTSNTVNYMMEHGASSDDILEYFVMETDYQVKNIDENFTGVYGYIQGEYLDGIGWEPPKGYVPQERDWYVAAVEAGGKPTIVAPYLDAQTNTIMISISQLLDDGESVVSFDVALNQIQFLTENIQMQEMGYGFIVDDTGLIVAHYDEGEKGKIYPTDKEQEELLSKIYKNAENNDNFQMKLSGETCTIFTNEVMDSWYVVLVVSNTKLFEDLRNHILLNVLICVVIFIMIVIFCAAAYRGMVRHQRRDNESRERFEQLSNDIVRALAYTIDAKDHYTRGHSQRVAKYSKEIAKRMGKTDEEQMFIYYAGLLHDVGKIRVPEDVINKPGRLTDEEFNWIKIHPVSGYHILKDIYEDSEIAWGAKYHHERYDGKGYPNGLSGDNIPEIARIIGVADAYDAMASTRSYRKFLPQEVVREEIVKGRGKQFDPQITDIMLEMIDDDKDYQMHQMDSEHKNILVVDDELMNIKMVEHIMKSEPEYHVFSALSAGDAMKMLEEQEIDLILLDVMMPDVDGYETLGMIREKYGSSIPVVFLTAEKSIETIQKSRELGVDDFLTKPFLPVVLKETIHGMSNRFAG